MAYYPGEPGYGSVFSSFGGMFGPTKSQRGATPTEGRGWNTNWMRYNLTREGRGSGYGRARWTSAWLRNRYQKTIERGERHLFRTPVVGPAYKAGKRLNSQVDDWLDRELSHVPWYRKMSRTKRAMLRNSMKGWVFERATGPQGLDFFDFFPSGSPGPSIPVPKFLTRSQWFPKKKRRRSRKRRYRR